MKENMRTWIPPIAEGIQHLDNDYKDFDVDRFVYLLMFMFILTAMILVLVNMKIKNIERKVRTYNCNPCHGSHILTHSKINNQ